MILLRKECAQQLMIWPKWRIKNEFKILTTLINRMEIQASKVAEKYREKIRESIENLNTPVKLVGVLASNDASSHTYSQFMKVGCDNVGVKYEEIVLDAESIEQQIGQLNADEIVTGVIVYYPIFGGEKDSRLRQVLSPYKDVEGLHHFWLSKLYANERKIIQNGEEVKALLPCTPLAVIKLLENAGEFPLQGKTVTIFNRSEVVGRPLAYMLSNDGARVYSFDLEGVLEFNKNGQELVSNISRKEALRNSDIIITGVPSEKFEKIEISEINLEACCLNFSFVENFMPDVKEKARVFIPRVGPVTVAMCLRNLARMAEFFR